MVQKRLRVFAGPNGSGKTTIINELKNKKNNEKINLGVYVNADDIELEFRTQNLLNLSNYKIKLTLIEIQNYFRNHAFSPNKLKSEDFWNTMLVSQNCIYLHKDQSINSYIAADFAALIREKLLSNNISFSFETVLSHISKLEFMEKAKNLGYIPYIFHFFLFQ